MWYLSHSAKGSTWKNHKYVRKENGKYVYDDTRAKSRTVYISGEDAHLQLKGADMEELPPANKATKLSGIVAVNASNLPERWNYKSADNSKKKSSSLNAITKDRLKNVANLTVSSIKSGDLKTALKKNKQLIDNMIKSKGKMRLIKNKKNGLYK